VTVTNTGRVAQGLYVYTAQDHRFELAGGRARPAIDLVTAFPGPPQQRYVLLRWSHLHAGDWSTGFDVLHLVPRTHGRSLAVFTLLTASEDPETGLCGVWSSTTKEGVTEHHQNIKQGKTTSIVAHQVLRAGTGSVRLVFTVKEQDCATLTTRAYHKTFALRQGRFWETSVP